MAEQQNKPLVGVIMGSSSDWDVMQHACAMLEQFGKLLAFNKGKGFCNLIAMPGPPIESALKLFPGDFQALMPSA